MSGPEPIGDPRDVMEELARRLAARDRLLVDGVIWCWNCGAKAALMPSLHCPQCLAAEYRRTGRVAPECVNRQQTPADVEAVSRG
jgi:hypothetical protein